jgi:hypothetical protein
MDATDSLFGILRENKVRLLIILVTISLFLIALNGLFSPFTLYGGSWVHIQAEKPLNVDEMRQMVLFTIRPYDPLLSAKPHKPAPQLCQPRR